MFVIDDRLKDASFWLNFLAPANMNSIEVTLDVSQFLMSWLKLLLLLNIRAINVTEEVFQSPIGWLKAWASLNIENIFVTMIHPNHQ